MERKLAESIVRKFNDVDGPTLSLFEAMAMNEVITDERKMFALQKGHITFLAWIKADASVETKTVHW